MLISNLTHFIPADLLLAHFTTHFTGHVYWKNQRGAYLGCNDNHAMRLGFASCLNILGKTDLELLEAIYSFSHYDDLVIREGRRRTISEDLVIGGSWVTLFSIKTPIIAKTGEVLGMMNYSIDKTQEKYLENQVKELEEKRFKPLEALRILIAEQNEVTNSLQYFFTQAGCLVDIVDDIDTLLKQTKTVPYGIIFMDVNMKDGKGVKITNRIRLQIGENQATPIVGFNACL